jgi:hypothetical protein
VVLAKIPSTTSCHDLTAQTQYRHEDNTTTLLRLISLRFISEKVRLELQNIGSYFRDLSALI